LRRFQASFRWFFFFLLFHASMMSDLIVDAHDVVESESHPTLGKMENEFFMWKLKKH
jgi:hypothetical protein